eukprot:CAMPEP_0168353676 /NCGR_PEP_ID=MMETSP0213-20121227/23402_1 /TAXON_ID=151035 /ORGANISM="Euplotes harpa, Strain FSP1.4" /LENGTH=133 /DNA_ID=CAMNT_0008365351 /DNA_START=288 /DNA_END=689 /DNA_ORIENTATION=-
MLHPNEPFKILDVLAHFKIKAVLFELFVYNIKSTEEDFREQAPLASNFKLGAVRKLVLVRLDVLDLLLGDGNVRHERSLFLEQLNYFIDVEIAVGVSVPNRVSVLGPHAISVNKLLKGISGFDNCAFELHVLD